MKKSIIITICILLGIWDAVQGMKYFEVEKLPMTICCD